MMVAFSAQNNGQKQRITKSLATTGEPVLSIAMKYFRWDKLDLVCEDNIPQEAWQKIYCYFLGWADCNWHTL